MSDILGSIGRIPQTIYNVFKTVMDSMKESLSGIFAFFNNFGEFLKGLFVPYDNYFEYNFGVLSDTFKAKFSFITQLSSIFENLKNSNLGTSSLKINFPYNFTLDFGWYEPYKQMFKNVLSGGFLLMFVGAIVKRNDPKINMGG